MSRDYLKEIFDIDTSKLNYDTIVFKPDDKYIRKVLKMYNMSIHEMRCIVRETDVRNNLLSNDQRVETRKRTVTLNGNEFEVYSGMIGGYKIRYYRNRTVVIKGILLHKEDDLFRRFERFKIEKSQRQITHAPELLKCIPIAVIEMIMKMLIPLDILSWFQVNHAYAAMSRNSELMCRFLSRYFPSLHYTSTPKLQFVAATYVAVSFYKMEAHEDDTFQVRLGINDEVQRYNYSEPMLVKNTCRINAFPGWSVNRMSSDESRAYAKGCRDKILLLAGLPSDCQQGLPGDCYLTFRTLGLPFPKGSICWLLVNMGSEMEYEVQLFKSREDLAKYYIENLGCHTDEITTMFPDMLDDIGVGEKVKYDGNVESWNDIKQIVRINDCDIMYYEYLEELGIRLESLTVEGLYKQAMNDEILYFNPTTYHYTYQVVKVIF
jgi:hypothetical protein